MAVPTRITDFNTTAASNAPTGSESVGTSLDDYLRGYQAVVALDLASKGADIASATTTDLGAVGGLSHDITGTTTITGFGTVRAGTPKIIKFEDALTLTHNATSLILPGGANITTADGDIAWFVSEGSGNWRCVSYFRAANSPTQDASATVKGVVELATQAEVNTGTDADRVVTAATFASGKPVLGTEQSPSAVTVVDFTSIPSWVKRITIEIINLSTNGTSDLILQIGDSGGFEATNYLGSVSGISNAVISSTATTGFGVSNGLAASDVLNGRLVVSLEDSAQFTWTYSGMLGSSASGLMFLGAGAKSLSAALDRVRLTTGGGTDTFDSGAVNILYE